MGRHFLCIAFSMLFLSLSTNGYSADLLFGVPSSLRLSEPGGAFESSVEISVSTTPTANEAGFSESTCQVSGDIQISGVDEGVDYTVSSTRFTLTTTPAGVASGDTFSSDTINLDILSDTQDEGIEVMTIAMRNVVIDCGNSSGSFSSQVVRASIFDVESLADETFTDRNALESFGQATLVSQVDDIQNCAQTASTSRIKKLSEQIGRSRKRAQRVDVSGLDVSIGNLALNCHNMPFLCSNSSSNNNSNQLDSDMSAWGMFVNGSLEIGERIENGQSKVDFNADTFNIGFDYRVNSNFILGAALNRSSLDYGAQDQTSVMYYRQLGASIFASYYQGSDFYVDMIISSGNSDYEFRRKITFGDIVGAADGNTDGSDQSVSVSSGYSFNFTNKELRLSGQLNYSITDIDDYQETSEQLIATAAVDAINITQLNSSFAADFTWNISTSFGVVIPQIGVSWEYLLSGNSVEIEGALEASNDSSNYSFQTQNIDESYASWRLGVSSIFKNGLTGYLILSRYAARDDVESTTASLGARLEF